MQPRSFAGQRVTIMGLGRFGGGLGVARFVAAQGPAKVIVTDLAKASALEESIACLADHVSAGMIELHLGGHDAADFVDTDVVVVNPAVGRPWNNQWIRLALDNGATITTEMGLSVEHLPSASRIIGVTGSLGKSTTTAMIHHILSAAGRGAWLGGNYGGSMLLELDDVAVDDWVVLEISSAMLYWLGHGMRTGCVVREPWADAKVPGWSPHVAVVTNISENHTDWHGDQLHYEQSKQQIVRAQAENDLALLGALCGSWRGIGGGGCEVFRDCDYESRSLTLQTPGAHNRVNALMAARACEMAAGIDMNAGLEALGDFAGLPHRLQCVLRLPDGGSFYNDSKATTPDAALRAVHSFPDPGRVHLIAGGYDKGLDLSPLAQLANQLAGLYTIGQVGPTIARLAGAGCVIECGRLETAVGRAIERMKAGDVVLLSPGCASWDQFRNFEQRGHEFCELVQSGVAHAGASGPKQNAAPQR